MQPESLPSVLKNSVVVLTGMHPMLLTVSAFLVKCNRRSDEKMKSSVLIAH